MILVIAVALLVVVTCFGFVVLFGAPYLPTLNKQVQIALDMADLKPHETLLELGCGDGKVLIAAAKRGWHAVGYELNPLLVLVCKLRTWRYREQVEVHLANFWIVTWPPAEAIFAFLLPKYMAKLDTKIMQSAEKPVKLVSFAFAIPEKKAAQSHSGVQLYHYK